MRLLLVFWMFFSALLPGAEPPDYGRELEIARVPEVRGTAMAAELVGQQQVALAPGAEQEGGLCAALSQLCTEVE